MAKELNSQRPVGGSMRPNIDISHQLNGRVKDFAQRQDVNVSEAYRRIIKRGLSELEAEE